MVGEGEVMAAGVADHSNQVKLSLLSIFISYSVEKLKQAKEYYQLSDELQAGH